MQFEQWMADHHGVKVKLTTTRSIHNDNKFILIDIPPEKRINHNITPLTGLITHLPRNGNYTFPMLPNVSFTMRAAICYRTVHYFAYALKGNQWYKLDCLPQGQPHVQKVDGLPNGLHQGCLLLLEKN